MSDAVDVKHLPALLGSAGKSIAGMPEGRKVIEQLRRARTKEDVLFVLRSVDLGFADPAREMVTRAAQDDAQWRDVKALLLRSAEHQLHERYSANA